MWSFAHQRHLTYGSHVALSQRLLSFVHSRVRTFDSCSDLALALSATRSACVGESGFSPKISVYCSSVVRWEYGNCVSVNGNREYCIEPCVCVQVSLRTFHWEPCTLAMKTTGMSATKLSHSPPTTTIKRDFSRTCVTQSVDSVHR